MRPTTQSRAPLPLPDAPSPANAAAASQPPDALLDAYRERIDALDQALVDLLVERTGLCVDVGRVKEALGLPVRAPAREAAVLDQVKRAARGPLAADAAARIFRAIIDETCRAQEEHRGARSSSVQLAGAAR